MKKLSAIFIAALLTIQGIVSAAEERHTIDLSDTKSVFYSADFGKTGVLPTIYGDKISYNSAKGTMTASLAAGQSSSANIFISNHSGGELTVETIVSAETAGANMRVQLAMDGVIKSIGGFVKDEFVLTESDPVSYAIIDTPQALLTEGNIYDVKFTYNPSKQLLEYSLFDLTENQSTAEGNSKLYIGSVCSRIKLDFAGCISDSEYDVYGIAVYEKQPPSYYRTVKISGAENISEGGSLSLTSSVTGGSAESVTYYLDGKEMFTSYEKPFGYEITSPEKGFHTLSATAVFKDGITAKTQQESTFLVSEPTLKELFSASTTLSAEADKENAILQHIFSKPLTEKETIEISLRCKMSDTSSSRVLSEIRNASDGKAFLYCSSQGEMYFEDDNRIAYEADKEYDVKIRFSTGQKTYSGTVYDGETEILSCTNVSYGNINDIVRIKLQQSRPAEGTSRTEITDFKISSVNGGEEIENIYCGDEVSETISPDTETISLKFKNSVEYTKDFQSNIKIIDAQTMSEIKFDGAPEPSDGKYGITFSYRLKSGTEYRIYVSENVKTADGNTFENGYYKSFMTSPDSVNLKGAVILNGDKPTQIFPQDAETVQVVPIMENTSDTERTVTVIICVYDKDGMMRTGRTENVTLASGELVSDREISVYTGDIPGASMSVYIWDSVAGQTAISNGIRL